MNFFKKMTRELAKVTCSKLHVPSKIFHLPNLSGPGELSLIRD